jgi:hypothetical protein
MPAGRFLSYNVFYQPVGVDLSSKAFRVSEGFLIFYIAVGWLL